MAAVVDDDESVSRPLFDNLGRACGSVFASSFIETLTSTTSPLTETTSQDGPAELQPEFPNEQQTLTYNAFCQAVWDSFWQLTRLHDEHTFGFGAKQDYWDRSKSGLTSIHVADYEERWIGSRIFRYQGLDAQKAPAAATGGAAGIFDEEIIGQVQEMARIFREKACPDDWNGGWNVAYGSLLQSCAEGERPNTVPNPEDWIDEIDVMASIKFRWEMGLLAEFIIMKWQLPVPKGEACLFWNSSAWKQEIKKNIPNSDNRNSEIAKRLMRGGFVIRPRPEQGPQWVRAWHYLSAAITEANLPEQETMNLIDEILRFMRQFREFEEKRLLPSIIENPQVWAKGRDWLESVGRRIRGHRSRRSLDESRQTPNAGSPSREQ
ncbi:hypothetical protein F5B18DRAFT_667831 [Nemania serpens]|nr:hypothetical protein F5B18DRAFT_667831 [Nemania serpens]